MASHPGTPAGPIDLVPLPGSKRPRPKESKLVGALEPGDIVSVTLLIRPRAGSPPLPDYSDWERTPPGERKFLSVEEYVKTYGASEADMQAIEAFIVGQGLTLVESHAGRRNVIARGTAAQVNAAFGVELNRYESPVAGFPRRSGGTTKEAAVKTQVHRGFDGPAYLPKALAEVVTAIVGLDNRRVGAVGGSGDPAGASFLSVPVLAQLYNFPNTGAADQTIGVLSGGGNYLSSDFTQHYFPSLPAGYQTPPTLVEVDLTYIESGSSVTFSNNPSVISSGNWTNADQELTQDISTSSTIAQGATVNVYFMDDTEPGWVAFLKRLLVPGSETQPGVVTSSWFFTNGGDDTGTIGDAYQTGTTANTLSGLFQEVGVQGITLFIAAGDWGSDDGQADGKCHVKYPASDPYVTCVGGTIVGAPSGNPPTFKEYVWSDAHNAASPFQFGSDSGATGGGVSDNFKVPAYQTAAGVAQKSNNDGLVRRGTPDVAGMVAYSGFYINGGLYPNYMGTSCVAPLYCGLIAVINSAIGRRTGFLNNILYPLGTSVTNDVTFGNNDSADTPLSTYYSAGPGWDACTGWGSLDGIKLLNGIVQSLFTQDMQFWVDDSTFGADEVKDTPTYADAFWLVLEGFTPNVLGISASNPSGTLAPVLSGSFVTLLGSGNIALSGAPVLELPDNYFTPQRIRFPYTITFPAGVPFPSSGEQAYLLSASITIPGNPTPFTASTVFELVAGADPYFSNINPTQNNVFWLSQDLRVFTATPSLPGGSPPVTGPGAPPFGPADDSVTGAYNYIQAVVNYLNGQIGYGNPIYVPPSPPAPDPLDTYISGQASALSGDSSVTPTTKSGSSSYSNYNFAIARVRLKGPASATSASNVKVFFRLFSTQTNDTDYVNTASAVSLADPFITFPSSPAGSPGDPQSPLPGTDASGNINGCTLPFFATTNYVDNPTDYDSGGVNNQSFSVPAASGGDTTWAFFGCFLNVYDTNNVYGGEDPQYWLKSGSHHCLVAQIADTGAPIQNSLNVVENPENCDKLAQRNLQVTPSGNPGFPLSHRIPQTFDLRPSPSTVNNPSGYLTDRPDELMIDFGDVPVGSVMNLYWPQVEASQVLALAAKYYSTHLLEAADAYTIRIPVEGDVGYVPIPTGKGTNFAGLLTLELPSGIRVRDEFQVIVRRITSRRPSDDIDHARASDASVNRVPNWRYVVGTFQMTIPVREDAVILPAEENLLSILK
ncbi:S53 family peptidase [Mycobacterium sp.]|uniref:S53 family peptidase n=1 Tax=Mycobacterium sp. TaxID=1785 RepID=UPI002C1E78C7|nr:S53 family peptidase [Mycobacterium sp.]HTQ22880.1 S53 family peptidase [Mycobacterium sp.]